LQEFVVSDGARNERARYHSIRLILALCPIPTELRMRVSSDLFRGSRNQSTGYLKKPPATVAFSIRDGIQATSDASSPLLTFVAASLERTPFRYTMVD